MTDYEYQYFAKDQDRSAFSLGWEDRRHGRPIESNPFKKDSDKWIDYREGWGDFKDKELRKYLKVVAG